MFWALLKSFLRVPCNNDEDKQRPQQNVLYFYIASTTSKIRDITKENKTQFSSTNIASQSASSIHKEAKFS